MERVLEVPTIGEKNPIARSMYGPQDGISRAVEQAILGRSLIIKGEISGVEALYIDGRVEGKDQRSREPGYDRATRQRAVGYQRSRDRRYGDGEGQSYL